MGRSPTDAADAAEADVAHPGVDHLRPAGGGAVALAVAVGAQVRAALDHLAGDAELRLGRVVAALHRRPRPFGRDAARRLGVLGVSRRPPVRRPLPHVAGHVVQAVAVGGVRADRRGRAVAVVVTPREVAVPVVRQPLARSLGFVAPHERRAVESAARSPLPLRLGRQRLARPRRVRLGVLVGDVHDRVVGATVERAAGSLRVAPRRARRPCSTTG